MAAVNIVACSRYQLDIGTRMMALNSNIKVIEVVMKQLIEKATSDDDVFVFAKDLVQEEEEEYTQVFFYLEQMIVLAWAESRGTSEYLCSTKFYKMCVYIYLMMGHTTFEDNMTSLVLIIIIIKCFVFVCSIILWHKKSHIPQDLCNLVYGIRTFPKGGVADV